MDGIEDNIYEINVYTVADTSENVLYYFQSITDKNNKIANNFFCDMI